MSFSVGPALGASAVLRGSTMSAMARAVGFMVGGGVLAATYGVMNDEAKTTVKSWRTRRAYRIARHEALLGELMGSDLHIKLQEHFLRSRNAFQIALKLLGSDMVKSEDKIIIRQALHRIQHGATE